MKGFREKENFMNDFGDLLMRVILYLQITSYTNYPKIAINSCKSNLLISMI